MRRLALAGAIAVVGLVVALVIAAWPLRSMRMGGMMGRGMSGMMNTVSRGSCPSQMTTVASATIEGLRFCPSPLRVQRGTTVTWTNSDSVAHTVTSQTGPQFDSGSLGQGRSWSHRLDRAGVFSYYCAIHPWMKGSIDVVD